MCFFLHFSKKCATMKYHCKMGMIQVGLLVLENPYKQKAFEHLCN